MALEVGSRLGHYDVTALIGEGGMGQVYQATDTKLNRQVALKILPEAFATDPDRLARFQREAQVLASLNHPNIAAIHGLEESDGIRALVLELVEGPTLADRIAQGSIPVDEALPIAKQIAEALEAAHEAGVIHRDLKPANIKVKDDGTVKVLDFGLAKAMQPDASDPSLSQSPTISLTAAATQMGMVIGTAAYMAPEQASGKVVDKRADIWAFGVVLYEMLTARRLFGGEDVSHTLAYVLTKEVEWSSLPDTPETLRRLLRRCLRRDQRRRLRDIGDARTELEEVLAGTVEAGTTPRTRPDFPWWSTASVGLSMLILGAAVGGVALWSMGESGDTRVERFEMTPRRPGAMGNAPTLAISPDGREVVFVASEDTGQLHVRSLDQLEVRTLSGLGNPTHPFFSPDGEWIGYMDGAQLKRVSSDGGPAIVIGSAAGTELQGASWAADGTIIFGSNAGTGLYRLSADGGEPEGLTSINLEQGEVSHVFPDVLPGGEAVVFTILGSDTCVFLPHIPTYIKSAGFCAGRSLSSQGQSSSMLEATTAAPRAKQARVQSHPIARHYGV